MSITTGVVRHGQLVLEGDEEPLPEGSRFTILLEDDEPTGHHLSKDQVKMLLESQASIRRGEYVTMEQMVKELDEE